MVVLFGTLIEHIRNHGLEEVSSPWRMNEQVQRRAARFVPRTYTREEGSVTNALKLLNWPSVKNSDVITLHVATERNKFGVDLGISISWYIKNYSYHTKNM